MLNQNKSPTKTLEKVKLYLEENSTPTAKEVAEALDVCETTARRNLHKLGYYPNKHITKSHNRYKDGAIVGDFGCQLVRRTFVTRNNKWKAIFKCGFCGKEFEAIISDVSSGQCKSCGCQKEHFIGEKVGPFGHTLLKRLYRSSGRSHEWHGLFECSFCGRTFESTISRIVNGSKSCCGCQSSSYGELIVRRILEEENIRYEQQKTFDGCVGKESGCLLRFDFYLPDYNCCIEYDGKQHFIPCKFVQTFTDEQAIRNYNRTVTSDNIKNEFCKNNNIVLIRIPYIDLSRLEKDNSFLTSKIFFFTSK